MRVLHGDLFQLALEGRFDVLVHGCNCFCTMGAGFAKGVREVFPEAWEADQATRRGDRSKLGSFSVARVERPSLSLWVVNAYTQIDYRGPGVRVSYDAVSKAFEGVGQRFAGQRIAYPRVGAGLAGGDWAVLRDRINMALEGQDHTLVEFSPSL